MARSWQRGFVRAPLLDLAFLFALILLAWGLWSWLSSIVTGEFMLAWFLVWLMATAAAWWWSRSQPLVLRLPAGFLLFMGACALFMPLSWWSGHKLVLAAEAVVAAVGARYIGGIWSQHIEARLKDRRPWYLDQSINLVNDFCYWMAACMVAWFAVAVLPLLSVFILPFAWVPWAALLWGFVLSAWFFYKYHPSRTRILKIPLGLWVFVASAGALQLFQKQFIGPLETGSIQQIAYTAFWPVVAGIFMEVVMLGTRRR